MRLEGTVLHVEKELREIFHHLRNCIEVNRDTGVEPPRLSADTLKFLDAGVPDAPGTQAGEDPPDSLAALRAFVGDCHRCKLHKGRTHLVFGEGSPHARLVFVGEGPGREEDLVGKPFVGEAGKMLTRIIENGMGLTREEVYICNVVKCRPPGNRDPERDEIETCIPFLKRQLAIIRPEVICALGRISAQALLGTGFKITRERGIWRSFEGIPLMATYHPAYILRNRPRERELKAQVWEDVKEIMKRLGLEVKRNG